MLAFSFFYFLIFLTLTISACPSDGITDNEGVCYKSFNISLNWYAAEAACAKDGGHLASIPDTFTNAFVSSYANSLLGYENYWIGGLANFDQYQNISFWEWIDYGSFKYTNWAPGMNFSY